MDDQNSNDQNGPVPLATTLLTRNALTPYQQPIAPPHDRHIGGTGRSHLKEAVRALKETGSHSRRRSGS